MGINIRRSTILKLALLGGLCFMLGFVYDYHLPKLESWLLVETERFSKEHLPVRVFAKRLRFHVIPLGVTMEDVRVLAKQPLDKYLAPATLREVGARLSLWPLFRGEIRLSQVFVRDSEFNLFLKNDLFAGQKGPPARIDFEKIYSLPIDEISLENVQIQGRLDPQNVVFRITDLNLLIENRYQSLFVEMDAPRVLIKPSGPVNPLNVQLELRSLIEANEMQISAVKIKADDSFVVASGRFNGDLAAGHIENGALDARTKLRLEDVNLWERIFFLKPKVPTLKGRAELDVGLEVRGGKGYKLETEINTKDVSIDTKYIVGNVRGHVSSDLKTLSSDSLSVENSAGKVVVEKLRVNLEQPKPSFSAGLKIPKLEVKQLLDNIDVLNVPIFIPVKGEANCEGAWTEAPELTCRGKLNALRVHVHTGRPSLKTIVETGESRINGEVKVTLKQVEYKGEIENGKSKGRSDGVINYDKGFKINYTGENVDFGDLKNLVNLKLEGNAKITGNTIGTSDWATIDMNVDGKNLWLEDYPLGNATTHVTYKTGKLRFENTSGQFEVSRYQGLVELDLIKDRIRISGQIPFMDLKDIQGLFQRKVTLPFQMNGTGTGRVEAEGPYRFQDLSYEFHSSFFRGSIAKEAFDEAGFNVKSVNGLVKSERIYLRKANGTIDVKGQITPRGEVDAVAVGRSMRLEQSENILQMGLDLQGLADFTVLVRGQLAHPRVELNGRLSKVVLADQPAEDSVFKLNFLNDRVEGSGQFFGTTLLSDFTYPYEDSGPFAFKLKTKKWDFTSLFSLVSKSARQLDFNTSVSMDVNLQSPQGGFWNSTGRVAVSEFVIRKAGKSMTSAKPMFLNFKQGVVNSQDFVISSGDSYLKLDVAGLTRKELNASVNGKMDLSLLGLFTPFISDLRGNMSISMDLKGSADKPMLSGSSYIDRGYVKFIEFPHPFSNIRADVLFNDNQILLNAVRAEMASGKLQGEGKITFAGSGSRPVEVRGTATSIKLNFPENFRSQGSGTVAIRGDRFPYTMDINYDVTGGDITSEFGEDSSAGSSVKASPYLPRFLDQDVFHPFNFNVDVRLKNPIGVHNEMVNAMVSGQVKATGTPDRLILNGSFTPLPGAKVLANSRAFDVQSALIEYNNAPPKDPKIYLTAHTRVEETVLDEQGRSSSNQYDVDLLVQGRGQAPQITLSSQPPLGQREIVSLLALGTTGGTNIAVERKNTGIQTASGQAAIGAALLSKAGGKRVKESLGVDVKMSSAQTTDNASTPKVTLSKQWTPKLGASASSTFEASPNNNVKIEYKVNDHVSAIGSWDERESLRDQKKATTTNVLGLDLQYKLQFK